jgi:phosphopantothenoylcysteine decarboxylase / phosphopantothenate---cysteine ligase
VRHFAERRVLLGVTGGIACYKAIHLARLLTQAGAAVDVVMTRSALEFIGAVTFEGVTGRSVHTELVAAGHALDHIRLARAADAIVVAPATADFCARAAHGFADSLLAAVLLAADAPVLLAPAMNDRMWAHPQTIANVERLREIGYRVLDPAEGALAVGEGSGPGRLPEPDEILAHVGRLLAPPSPLRGRRVLVTAGPTRETVDPVRYLSNRSSGHMGIAIAAEAWRRGAEVTLVAGPTTHAAPAGPAIVRVETAAEMLDAVSATLPSADVVLMAAAPADFRPASPAAQKIKKGDGLQAIALEQTTDILVETRDRRKSGAVVVGFALETTDAEANARKKLAAKDLAFVVLNDATEPGAGFTVPTNRVTIVRPDADGVERLPLMSKEDVAAEILDRVEATLGGR